MKKLYFAYGSNLNIDQMQIRCPDAEPLTSYILEGWRLVFRGVLDIVPDKNSQVHGGIYAITSKCERALDRYEGFPRLYIKETVHHEMGKLMFYVMKNDPIHRYVSPPCSSYFYTCLDGFNHWDLPEEELIKARRRAFHALRRREKRRHGVFS